MTDKSRKKTADKEEEESVQTELEKAREDADRYLDMARRLQADFDNYRKRSQKENEEFRKYANEGIVKELLPVVDDLDRALATAKEETDLSVGIRGVRKNLMKMLEEKGVREVPAAGRFDPNYHEALCTIEADTDGEIAEVLQKGYMMDARVLRYAKVKVTKKKQETTGEQICQE